MKPLVLLIVCTNLLWVVTQASAQTLYVDDDASTNGNGQSWSTAYKYLQDALHDADTNGGITEIHVGQGTYKPDQDEGGIVTPDARTATFQLLSGVALTGGYAGIGAPDPDLRDVDSNASILNGDLAGDDVPTNGPDIAHNSENSLSVLTGDDTDSSAVLDGFLIVNGNADRGGGGMRSQNGSPMVANCTFMHNAADDVEFGGGGMRSQGGNPTLTGCIFRENATGAEGGAVKIRGSITAENCLFADNRADNGGGAMMFFEEGTGSVINCVFLRNTTPDFAIGGGLWVNDSTVMVSACTFIRNAAGAGGGIIDQGQMVLVNSVFTGNEAIGPFGLGGGMVTTQSPTVTNCTFSGNTAGFQGGGMLTYSNSPTVTNCIFWGNSDAGGIDESGQIHVDTATPVVNHSNIQGGWTGLGGNNTNADPLFVDSNGTDNIPGTEDDDVRLLPGSPCIDTGDDDADIDASTSGLQPLPPTDVDGNPRIFDCHVDIGAYEFQGENIMFGDFDDNCLIDLDDYEVFEICLSLSGPGGDPFFQECSDIFDSDDDGDVDLADFSAFQIAISIDPMDNIGWLVREINAGHIGSIPAIDPTVEQVITGTGLRYFDIVTGSGDSAVGHSFVTVDYVMWLVDEVGTFIDQGSSAQFSLGGVISGFAEGVGSMNVGGVRRMFMPPELGFGEGGNPGAGVPPNAWLVFDVELLAVSD